MHFDYVLAYSSMFSVAIPFIYGIGVGIKQHQSIRRLLLLLGLSIVTSMVTVIYTQAGSSTSLLYFNIYTPLEFIAISLLYIHLLPYCEKLIAAFIGVFTLFFIIDSLFLESITEVQNYPLILESVLVILYGLMHLFHFHQTAELKQSVLRNGQFWITIALVTYFLYNMAIFLMARKVLTQLDPTISRAVWNFHNLNYLVRNAFLTLAIYYFNKTKQEGDCKSYSKSEDWRAHPPNWT